uniref:Si:dkey-35m8.1 n=1 Tax=Oryzias sinensis TaxID=183150 RepID=A0A8C7XTS9_9TELE
MLSREKKKEEEAGFALDLGFLPHAASMFSCVGCFWVLLSSALVAVCSFSFISPAWIVKEQPRSGHQHPHPHDKGSVSFGLLWHCSESLDRMYRCYTFGGLGRFAEIPSSSWQTSAVLCSGGCALLAVSSLLAIITVFLPSGGCERRACTLAGYMQMAADQSGLICNTQDLIYPGLFLHCWERCSPVYDPICCRKHSEDGGDRRPRDLCSSSLLQIPAQGVGVGWRWGEPG